MEKLQQSRAKPKDYHVWEGKIGESLVWIEFEVDSASRRVSRAKLKDYHVSEGNIGESLVWIECEVVSRRHRHDDNLLLERLATART